MRFINKKVVVVVLLLIEFTCGYLMYQSSKKNIDLAKVTYEEEIKDSMFAMYVENEDTGEYDEVTNTNTFPEGYILNMDKTGCIDNKGNSISDILTSKDDKVMVKSNKTVFCYLYFDKDNRVYTQVKSDYKNNTGALLLSETESDEYPVYYYSGNITNNNILYANFCWKMVRTTETGGVKLIYNGVPDEVEDGTLTCDNTGEESTIGKSAFNSTSNSLAYSGYMYNDIYNTEIFKPTIDKTLIRVETVTDAFYYGDTVTWNGAEYVLSNKDGSEVTAYTWSDNYTNLVGKYTCKYSSKTSCSEVYYLVDTNSTRMRFYALSEGMNNENYVLKLATSVTDNDDGTYTLVDPIEILKKNWYTNYASYKNYYYCNDLVSETCGADGTIMYYSTSSSSESLTGINISNVYKYGNSFTYENGTYKLVDTKEFWDWSTNYNQINNNHYTCFNVTGECEEVKYIYETSTLTASYITLSDGEYVENAINKMLYVEGVNGTNSTIKTYIDTWYEDALLDEISKGGVLYSAYLENTIFCNSRETGELRGWNPNGGRTTQYLVFNTDTLECTNKTDQFTLKVEAGGTEGYGNNALDYPIGLLTLKEIGLLSDDGYKKNGNEYWAMTPTAFIGNSMIIGRALNNGYGGSNAIYSVRPVVSLSNKVEIIEGDGSATAPYQIILPS